MDNEQYISDCQLIHQYLLSPTLHNLFGPMTSEELAHKYYNNPWWIMEAYEKICQMEKHRYDIEMDCHGVIIRDYKEGEIPIIEMHNYDNFSLKEMLFDAIVQFVKLVIINGKR